MINFKTSNKLNTEKLKCGDTIRLHIRVKVKYFWNSSRSHPKFEFEYNGRLTMVPLQWKCKWILWDSQCIISIKYDDFIYTRRQNRLPSSAFKCTLTVSQWEASIFDCLEEACSICTASKCPLHYKNRHMNCRYINWYMFVISV